MFTGGGFVWYFPVLFFKLCFEILKDSVRHAKTSVHISG